MTKKKNKDTKSAFYFFMLDYKTNAEKAGRKFPNGLADVQQQCAPDWNSMSKHEKAPYEKLAKEEKFRAKEQAKQAGTGESIDLIEKLEREKLEFFENMKENITRVLSNAKATNTLTTKQFYVIHVHYFYHKMAGLNEVDYEPAEVAVVRFSLKNGIEAVFHKIMYWELELGYRRFHTEHSQKTHQIPDKYELGEKNYKNVYNELMQFIAPDGDLENLPPLYCYDKENIAPVKSFVKRIANASGQQTNFISIYSLEWFLSKLYNQVTEGGALLSYAFADNEFLKDKFAFNPHLECDFHAFVSQNSPLFCSVSIAKRWIFVICEWICEKLEIEMVPGKHCPPDGSDFTSKLRELAIGPCKSKVTGINSMTNVSSNHREKATGRSYADERQRREEPQHFTIVQYSTEPKSELSPPSSSSSTSTSTLSSPQITRPKNSTDYASKFATSSSRTFDLNDDQSFPSIGSTRTNSINRPDYDSNYPSLGGRGRGSKGKGRGRNKA